MSKKKYDCKNGKVVAVGCNSRTGWLLTTEEIALVRYYLFLAGEEFKRDSKKNLRENAPKNYILHQWRKYREVVALYDALNNRLPYSYVRA